MRRAVFMVDPNSLKVQEDAKDLQSRLETVVKGVAAGSAPVELLKQLNQLDQEKKDGLEGTAPSQGKTLG